MPSVIDQFVARDDLMRRGYAWAIEEGLLGALGSTRNGEPGVAEAVALKDAVLAPASLVSYASEEALQRTDRSAEEVLLVLSGRLSLIEAAHERVH